MNENYYLWFVLFKNCIILYKDENYHLWLSKFIILTHYCPTATLVTVLSNFFLKKGSWKNFPMTAASMSL